ncbi:hypothetical protein PHJA_001120700 [Phtheirospermum japonicum]|uniref:Uncharacterized protein n=1 Tax=Phtheirospermum japonicum TaxID=374723 RepID=A0A830BUG9_9LAMI|nr:hypothetical protein PHJA_001120700 [Phtheirospermum japonicum]
MDHQNQELESRRSGSFGRLSHVGSSRRRSLSTSFALPRQIDDAVENESVSEAGDIGDRALHSNRISTSSRSRFSFDSVSENRIVFPIQDNINPCPPAIENDEKEVHWLLEYITCLLSLAVFGILGVLARYCLQKLFGPNVVGATSDESYMYVDLPSNMIGSFLMGWLGVIFKGDILKISDQLAIGLTTGFLGSLTTFSGWNQKMLDLSIEGRWVFAVLGLFLVAYSIIFGIETAKGFKWLLRKSDMESFYGINICVSKKSHCLWTFMVMLLLMLVLLWGLFGSLAGKEFETGSSEAQLFLACMVGPFGVWIRWFLARFNGRGLGKNSVLKWMPFGTLAANVLAACVMAALAILKKAVNTKNCDTVASGIQFGLLGCLSTVSTFIAEFHAMRESSYPWRAYAYATITFLTSFVLGTLIYSVPVWVKGYS